MRSMRGARAAEHERHEVVDPARLDTAVEERRATRTARRLQQVADVGLGGGRIAERRERRRHDVLAGAQTPSDVVGRLAVPVVAGREVSDDLGIDRERRIDVARRDDAGRRQAAEVARVAAFLRHAVHDQAGELEARVLDHRPQRADPHLPGSPQHDSRHRRPGVAARYVSRPSRLSRMTFLMSASGSFWMLSAKSPGMMLPSGCGQSEPMSTRSTPMSSVRPTTSSSGNGEM